jgi:hypothetical protein
MHVEKERVHSYGLGCPCKKVVLYDDQIVMIVTTTYPYRSVSAYSKHA